MALSSTLLCESRPCPTHQLQFLPLKIRLRHRAQRYPLLPHLLQGTRVCPLVHLFSQPISVLDPPTPNPTRAFPGTQVVNSLKPLMGFGLETGITSGACSNRGVRVSSRLETATHGYPRLLLALALLSSSFGSSRQTDCQCSKPWE